MSQSSPFLNRWLSQVGPNVAIEALSDLLANGALYVVDAGGRVLFWSRGAERLLGFSHEKVLGQPCKQVIRCSDGRPFCCASELGIIKDAIVELERADGVEVRVRRSARAFFDAGGLFAGALEVLWPEAGLDTVQRQSERHGGVVEEHA